MGKFEIVKQALKEEASPNIRDANGNSLLIYAASCQKNYMGMSALFIERGVDLNTVNRFGTTALHIAIIGDKLDLAKYLIEWGAKVDPVCEEGQCSSSIMCEYTIPNRRKDVVNLLLEHGADSKAPWKDGKTPINVRKRKVGPLICFQRVN